MTKMILFLLLICMTGCKETSTAGTREQALIIDHVSVQYRHNGASLFRNYRKEDDIQGLMDILRTYYPIGDCSIPEYPPGDTFTVTVFCSNGSTHTYEIQGFSFLRRDHGLWQQISVSDRRQLPLYLMCHLGDAL